ncbi:MAG TPA: SAM-dependent methyltransferase, partial [Actinomycetota bacterium]|nr:SAM-dependent methyltransferase [Actinomycetota bacterium]
RARLSELADDPRTMVLYESPRRVRELVDDALEVLGDRPAAIARELTKAHQEVRRARLSELAATLGDVRGEVVVVLGGAPKGSPDLLPLVDRVAELTASGVSRRDAVADVAAEARVSRRALYEASLRGESEDGG